MRSSASVDSTLGDMFQPPAGSAAAAALADQQPAAVTAAQLASSIPRDRLRQARLSQVEVVGLSEEERTRTRHYRGELKLALRVGEAMRERSANAEMIFVTLPFPQTNKLTPRQYCALLQSMADPETIELDEAALGVHVTKTSDGRVVHAVDGLTTEDNDDDDDNDADVVIKDEVSTPSTEDDTSSSSSSDDDDNHGDANDDSKSNGSDGSSSPLDPSASQKQRRQHGDGAGMPPIIFVRGTQQNVMTFNL
jgi:hypothetical protein